MISLRASPTPFFLSCPKQKAQHGNKCYEAKDSYNLHSITPHFRLYRFRLYRLSLTLLLPSLFLVTMHDGMLKQGIKSFNRLYRIVSLQHRNSFYSTMSTPPLGPVPLSFQPLAQRQEFFKLGDDALLLRKGRKGN